MEELVITEVALPMPPNKINSVIERKITLQLMSNGEFTIDED